MNVNVFDNGFFSFLGPDQDCQSERDFPGVQSRWGRTNLYVKQNNHDTLSILAMSCLHSLEQQ